MSAVMNFLMNGLSGRGTSVRSTDSLFGELVVVRVGYHTSLFVGFGPCLDGVEEVKTVDEGGRAVAEGRVVNAHSIAYGFPVCSTAHVVNG
jgi:hypothetical protein